MNHLVHFLVLLVGVAIKVPWSAGEQHFSPSHQRSLLQFPPGYYGYYWFNGNGPPPRFQPRGNDDSNFSPAESVQGTREGSDEEGYKALVVNAYSYDELIAAGYTKEEALSYLTQQILMVQEELSSHSNATNMPSPFPTPDPNPAHSTIFTYDELIEAGYTDVQAIDYLAEHTVEPQLEPGSPGTSIETPSSTRQPLTNHTVVVVYIYMNDELVFSGSTEAEALEFLAQQTTAAQNLLGSSPSPSIADVSGLQPISRPPDDPTVQSPPTQTVTSAPTSDYVYSFGELVDAGYTEQQALDFLAQQASTPSAPFPSAEPTVYLYSLEELIDAGYTEQQALDFLAQQASTPSAPFPSAEPTVYLFSLEELIDAGYTEQQALDFLAQQSSFTPSPSPSRSKELQPSVTGISLTPTQAPAIDGTLVPSMATTNMPATRPFLAPTGALSADPLPAPSHAPSAVLPTPTPSRLRQQDELTIVITIELTGQRQDVRQRCVFAALARTLSTVRRSELENYRAVFRPSLSEATVQVDVRKQLSDATTAPPDAFLNQVRADLRVENGRELQRTLRAECSSDSLEVIDVFAGTKTTAEAPTTTAPTTQQPTLATSVSLRPTIDPTADSSSPMSFPDSPTPPTMSPVPFTPTLIPAPSLVAVLSRQPTSVASLSPSIDLTPVPSSPTTVSDSASIPTRSPALSTPTLSPASSPAAGLSWQPTTVASLSPSIDLIAASSSPTIVSDSASIPTVSPAPSIPTLSPAPSPAAGLSRQPTSIASQTPTFDLTTGSFSPTAVSDSASTPTLSPAPSTPTLSPASSPAAGLSRQPTSVASLSPSINLIAASSSPTTVSDSASTPTLSPAPSAPPLSPAPSPAAGLSRQPTSVASLSPSIDLIAASSSPTTVSDSASIPTLSPAPSAPSPAAMLPRQPTSIASLSPSIDLIAASSSPTTVSDSASIPTLSPAPSTPTLSPAPSPAAVLTRQPTLVASQNPTFDLTAGSSSPTTISDSASIPTRSPAPSTPILSPTPSPAAGLSRLPTSVASLSPSIDLIAASTSPTLFDITPTTTAAPSLSTFEWPFSVSPTSDLSVPTTDEPEEVGDAPPSPTSTGASNTTDHGPDFDSASGVETGGGSSSGAQSDSTGDGGQIPRLQCSINCVISSIGEARSCDDLIASGVGRSCSDLEVLSGCNCTGCSRCDNTDAQVESGENDGDGGDVGGTSLAVIIAVAVGAAIVAIAVVVAAFLPARSRRCLCCAEPVPLGGPDPSDEVESQVITRAEVEEVGGGGASSSSVARACSRPAYAPPSEPGTDVPIAALTAAEALPPMPTIQTPWRRVPLSTSYHTPWGEVREKSPERP